MEYDEHFYEIFDYFQENVGGLFLLILVFFIVYAVDYVNQINIMLYSTPGSIPGLTNVQGLTNVHGLTNVISNSYKKTKKIFKKR